MHVSSVASLFSFRPLAAIWTTRLLIPAAADPRHSPSAARSSVTASWSAPLSAALRPSAASSSKRMASTICAVTWIW